MGDDRPAVKAADGTVLLFTTVPGMSITVPPYGDATHTTPVQVPAALVDVLCEEGRLSTLAPGDFRPLATVPDAEPDGPEYHATGGKVYHDRPDCPTGNNVEKPIPGKGKRLRFCPECKELADASAKE